MRHELYSGNPCVQSNRLDLPPKPEDIPTNPRGLYRDKGWNGMGNWFGTAPGKKARKMTGRKK